MIRFVIIPEIGIGKGTGHLVRCIALATELADSALFIPGDQRSALLSRYPKLEKLTLCGSEIFSENDTSPQRLFIVDKPEFLTSELDFLLSKGLVAGVDLRGLALRRLPLLVDILPRLRNNQIWCRANFTEPLFMDLPTKKREAPVQINHILVAFGGEDVGNLRKQLIASSVLDQIFPLAEVTLLEGPRMAQLEIPVPETWKKMSPQEQLADRIHEWDLVLTSFGLTAYEARAAGCRVVLLNPSGYHEKLAKIAGFASAGVRKATETAFRKAVSDACVDPPKRSIPLRSSEESVADSEKQTAGPRGLANFFEGIPELSPSSCPACRAQANRVIARFAERSFFSCARCGIWYETLFSRQKITYNEAYFFEEYHKQYGKTYLDDFQHIQAMGSSRLDHMRKLGFVTEGQNLLDIGCAYGPFLKAAAERGLRVQGCDISPEAVAWVQNNLGFSAQSGDIRTKTSEAFGGPLDIVSLWYVIEHFPDLYRVLSTLNGLLKKGGLLALATPSGSGISARARRLNFLAQSPSDHYTIWRPSTVRRLLKLYGFKLRSIRVTGHHPERFPGIFGSIALRPLSLLISRVFGLGDTFELYAEKRADNKGQ